MSMIETLKKKVIIAENNNYLVRNLSESDREDYIVVFHDCSTLPENELMEDMIWNNLIDETHVTRALERKVDSSFVGTFLVKNADPDSIEIGMDLKKEFQQQGIATEIVPLMVETLKTLFPEKKIIARVYSENDVSQNVVRKLGGMKIREDLSEYDLIITKMKEKWKELPEPEVPLGLNHIDVYEFW